MTDVPDWDDAEARETPVRSGRCLWCKSDIKHLEDTTNLETGEDLCQSCLGDLREWKRTRFADLLVAPSLEEATQTALLNEWHDLRDLLAEVHHEEPGFKALPSRTSNAYERRIHDDSSAGGSSS